MRENREQKRKNQMGVQEIIESEIGLRMPIRTVGEYLYRWGFTPQKPLEQACEQRSAVFRRDSLLKEQH